MVDFGDTPSQQITALVVILNRAIPLFLAGLAVAIAFRMGLFNIGVEGQYRLATIMAAAAGAAVCLPGAAARRADHRGRRWRSARSGPGSSRSSR